MATLDFNAQDVAPQQAFTPIPAGVYTTTIVDSEVKTTQKGGTMAVFHLQVAEGPHAGRRVFARINVRNASPDAERIGQSQLSALCHAAGVVRITDTVQLHGRAVRARVKIRKSDEYGDSNEVSGFEAVAGAPVPPTAAAPAAPGAPVPPWAQPKAA